MIGWRRLFTGLALVTSVAMVVSACQIDGSAQPNAAAVAAIQVASSLSSAASGATSRSDLISTPAQSSAVSTPPTTSTIEDHSTSELPPTTSSSSTTPTPTPTPTPTTAGGPTVMMANDGYAVSILVTTVWARALIAKGARVGIRTIGETADQVRALKSGQVDLVQQFNSGLLSYLDKNSDATSRTEVDSAIAAALPTGLSVLNSTAAKDDVQLTVSAATATRFQLHSISDLGAHLADITLLLPGADNASSFASGLSNYYGLTFPTTKTADFGGSTTIAAIRTTAAVGAMAASQYQIDDDKLVVLTDPRHLFLTENFIPLVSNRKITAGMKGTINAVSAKLSVPVLRGMRRKVATGQGSYADVADAWLASVGLK